MNTVSLLEALDLLAEGLTGDRRKRWDELRPKLTAVDRKTVDPDLFYVDHKDGVRKQFHGWEETAAYIGVTAHSLRCTMSEHKYCVVKIPRKLRELVRITRPYSVDPDHPEWKNSAFNPETDPGVRQAAMDMEVARSKGWDPRLHGSDYTQFLPRPKFVRKPPAKK